MNLFKNSLFKFCSPVLRKINYFHNAHRGESCYIFGDGVSVKWFELKAFNDRICFTLGVLPFHKRSADLNIKYSLLVEPKYFYPYFKLPSPYNYWWKNNIQIKYREMFNRESERDFFVNLSNYPVLRGRNIYHTFQRFIDVQFDFQKQCIAEAENMYDGSFSTAITLAVFMGFSKITLVGCDYTHADSRSLHWYEKGEGVRVSQLGYKRKFIEIAQKNVSIDTITTNGGGSYLKGITYKNFTGKELRYQENYELLDLEILNSLASWPGYNIF